MADAVATVAEFLPVARPGSRPDAVDEPTTDARRFAEALSILRGYAWELDFRTGRFWTSPTKGLTTLPSETVPRTYAEFESAVHPDDRGALRQALVTHLRGERPAIEAEYRLIGGDGQQIWVLDRARVTERDGAGRALRLVGMRADITERKKQEERQRIAQEAGGIGTYEIDMTDGSSVGNARFYGFYGLPADHGPMSFAEWVERIHPDDRGGVLAHVAAVLKGGDFPEVEYRVVRPDGSIIWTSSRTHHATDGRGRITRAWGVQCDITQRKLAELALAERERELKTVFDQAIVGIAHRRLDGKLLAANARFSEIIGVSPEELEHVIWSDIVHPDDYAALATRYVAHIQSGAPLIDERRFLKPDGDVVWCRINVSLLRDEAGVPASRVTVIDDITEKKRAEQALLDREDQLSMIFNQAVVGIAYRSVDGRLYNANARYCEILGRPLDELRGLNWRDVAHPDDIADVERRFTALEGDDEMVTELRCIRPDGSIVWCRAQLAYLRAQNGKEASVVIVMDDISEQKQAEASVRTLLAKLDQATRLVTANALGATLAHELQQPHAAITNYLHAASMMLSKSVEPAELAPVMDNATKQAIRAGDIVRRMRQFVALGRPETRPDQLREVVAQLLDVMPFGTIATPRVDVAIDDDLGAVDIDRIQIQQVLTNLIKNAIEASPAQARIRIEARRVDDGWVEVSVVDHGSGVPPAVAESLFQLFSTTKSQGMGLGLAIARTIVEGHGGRIWVDSQSGRTAVCFTVKLCNGVGA